MAHLSVPPSQGREVDTWFPGLNSSKSLCEQVSWGTHLLQLCTLDPAPLEGLSAASNSANLPARPVPPRQGPSFPGLAHSGRGCPRTGLCFWPGPSKTRVLGPEADQAGEQSQGQPSACLLPLLVPLHPPSGAAMVSHELSHRPPPNSFTHIPQRFLRQTRPGS